MKKTIASQSSQEEKIEFNCKCCKALGIADIIREMMEKDLQKDLGSVNEFLSDPN